MIELTGYNEIKYPLFHAVKDEGYTVWFQDMHNTVVFFDDTPMNPVRWRIGNFTSVEAAKKRAIEMLKNEGWELVETQWADIAKEEEK